MKFNKGQITTNPTILLVGALLLFGLVFLVSGSSNIDGAKAVDKASSLADNTQTNDKQNQDQYDNENQDKKAVDITDINNTNLQNGSYIVNTTDNNKLEFKNTQTNQTQVVEKSSIGNWIKLNNGQEITNVWINTNYDVNGFSKYFEAILVKDTNWNNYVLFYRIGDEKFMIKDLYLNDYETNKNILIAYGNYDDGYYVPKRYVKDAFNGLNISNSMLLTDNNEIFKQYSINKNKFVVVNNKEIRIISGLLSKGNYNTWAKATIFYLNQNKFNNFIGDLPQQDLPNTLFNVNDLDSYSKPSIAEHTPTRTIGFNTVTIVKQEITNGINSFTNKNVKIADSSAMKELYNNNKDLYTSLLQDRIKKNIVFDNSNNVIAVGNETYEIGTDITGLVMTNGYISQNDLLNGSVVEVSQVKFNPENSKGLQMRDLGSATLRAEQQSGIIYGNLKDNFKLQTHGRTYFVDSSLWDRALGILYNIVSFDFSSVTQYWNDYKDNAIISDDINSGNVNGDIFVYESAFKDSNTQSLTFTNQKPIDNLLTYNGQNYWLFYTLETQDSSNGCLIIETYNDNLDVDMPMGVCGNVLGGINSVSQFKIYAEEEN